MAIILFLVDTSASMAQKTYKGNSLLDVCKNFVVEFIKMRGRDVSTKGFDRYMFMTTEEYPNCIKELRTQWRENALMEVMKPLRPKGRCSLSTGLLNAFRVINLNRAQSGIENYGYGRYPFYMEQLVIIALTDGQAVDDVPLDFRLELRNRHDFTKEAYRWDERLYSITLRIPGQSQGVMPIRPDSDIENIDRLCVSTGGRSFSITNHRQLAGVIEELLLALQSPGVLVRFTSPVLQSLAGPGINNGLNGLTDSHPEIRLKKGLDLRPLTNVLVKVVGGKAVMNHWPIPEAFWHTQLENNGLPLRPCHPNVVFSMDFKPSQIMTDFPFDKYELEPSSPIVDYILDKTKAGSPDQCLFVFVHGSYKNEGIGKPFGYLKMTSAGTGVNLFIMPYNFPALFPLLQELKADTNVRNNPTWKRRFDAYLEALPPYYITPMRKNLAKFRITGGLLDDMNYTNSIYPSTLLGAISRAKPISKDELDRLAATVQNQMQELTLTTSAMSQLITMERRPKPLERKHWRIEAAESAKKDPIVPNPNPRGRRDPRTAQNQPPQSTEEISFKDPSEDLASPAPEKIANVQVLVSEGRIKQHPGSAFRNPLVLKKHQVVPEVVRMKVNMNLLLRSSSIPLLDGGRPGLQMKLHHSDELHSLPVAQMGNYEEYIKALHAAGRGPLRDVEDKPVRMHAFGNPFKTDKKNMAVDEVSEGVENNSLATKEARKDRKSTSTLKRPPRRKAGPLGINSLSNYREKLRSISECSSVVSDLSYTTDVEMSDVDDTSVSSPSTSADNALEKADSDNGNGAMVKGEEPMEIEGVPVPNGLIDEPPAKRARHEEPSIRDQVRNRKKLSREQIVDKKSDLATIIRNNRICPDALKQIIRVIENCCPSDAIDMLSFTQRDAVRVKRSDLTKLIAEEILKWKNLLLL